MQRFRKDVSKKEIETMTTNTKEQKVNTVKTSTNNTDILPNLDTMSLEQRAQLFAMLRRDSAVVTQAKSTDDAELNRLNAEKTRIEGEIAPLNEKLKEIVIAIKAIGGRVTTVGDDAPRNATLCVCGKELRSNHKCKAVVTAPAAPQASAVQ